MKQYIMALKINCRPFVSQVLLMKQYIIAFLINFRYFVSQVLLMKQYIIAFLINFRPFVSQVLPQRAHLRNRSSFCGGLRFLREIIVIFLFCFCKLISTLDCKKFLCWILKELAFEMWMYEFYSWISFIYDLILNIIMKIFVSSISNVKFTSFSLQIRINNKLEWK